MNVGMSNFTILSKLMLSIAIGGKQQEICRQLNSLRITKLMTSFHVAMKLKK